MQILLFGIAKEIVGQTVLEANTLGESVGTVGELKARLCAVFPAFVKLATLAVAVNNEYAADSVVLQGNEEVAIIPPVSGG